MKKRVLLIILAALLLVGCAPAAGGTPPPQASAAPSTLTTPTTAAAAAPADVEVPFAAQYIRTDGYSPSKKYPASAVIRSAAQLEDYYAANKGAYNFGSRDRAHPSMFTGAMKKYDDAYFKDNALILVCLREPSGEVEHNVSSVTSSASGLKITVERLLPEEQTQKSSRWHIFVEVGSEYAEGDVSVKLADKYYTAKYSIEVPFTAKYIKTAGYFTWPAASVIYTSAGLYEYYKNRKDEYFLDGLYNDSSESFRGAMKKYDAEYFENNALIIIRASDVVPKSYSVRSVIVSGGVVTVTLERLVQEQPGISMSWHVLIEAGKGCINSTQRLKLKTVTVSEESQIPFTAQYIRGGHVYGTKYPVTTVMRSAAELMEYYTANTDADGPVKDDILAKAIKRYDEAYFKDNALVLIQFPEPSGSIRHNVSSVIAGNGGLSITIERLLPEEQTADMAGWQIFVEIVKDKASDNVTVTFTDIDSNPPSPI